MADIGRKRHDIGLFEAVEAPEGALRDRYDLLLRTQISTQLIEVKRRRARAPFPPIEIIRWWPKLREEDSTDGCEKPTKADLKLFFFPTKRCSSFELQSVAGW